MSNIYFSCYEKIYCIFNWKFLVLLFNSQIANRPLLISLLISNITLSDISWQISKTEAALFEQLPKNINMQNKQF
jgi:hypothetical protein